MSGPEQARPEAAQKPDYGQMMKQAQDNLKAAGIAGWSHADSQTYQPGIWTLNATQGAQSYTSANLGIG